MNYTTHLLYGNSFFLMALGLPHLPLSKRDDPLFVFGEWRTEPFEVEDFYWETWENAGTTTTNTYKPVKQRTVDHPELFCMRMPTIDKDANH